MEPTSVTPRAARLLAALIALAGTVSAFALAGCGEAGSVGYTKASEADRTAGKQLFVAKCGACHVMQDARTRGEAGPDLDFAFKQALADGIPRETVLQVVRDQIQYPITETSTGKTGAPGIVGMPGIDTLLPECDEKGEPQGCVGNQDKAADDISSYVAYAAAPDEPGASLPPAPQATTGGETTTGPSGGGELAAGKQVFASAGCGSCHKLADVGTTGTVGPDLDQSKPPKALVVDRVTNGRGAMPPFKGQLSGEQIDAVATYVSSVAGK